MSSRFFVVWILMVSFLINCSLSHCGGRVSKEKRSFNSTKQVGNVLTHVFKRGNTQCISICKLPTTPEICIERVYNTGEKECLILKPIDPKRFKEVHQVVSNSQAYIGEFERVVVDLFSTLSKTRDMLLSYRLNMKRDPRYLVLGIFYKKGGESNESFIGLVGLNPYGDTAFAYDSGIPQGSYGWYWIGDPAYTGVKGVGYLCFDALVRYQAYLGNIRCLRLVIHMDNAKSNGVAKKMGMKRVLAVSCYPREVWPYPQVEIEKSYLYTLWIKDKNREGRRKGKKNFKLKEGDK